MNFKVGLHSWTTIKKKSKWAWKRLHILLTLLVFLYILTKIAQILLPWLPNESILVLGLFMTVVGGLGEDSVLWESVFKDLDRIPPTAHYIFFFIVALPLYVYFKFPAVVAYVLRLKGEIESQFGIKI